MKISATNITPKPKTLDEIYYDMAIQLANLATNAIEECESYIEGIEDTVLKANAERYLDNKIG